MSKYDAIRNCKTDHERAAVLLAAGNPYRAGNFGYHGESQWGTRDTIIYAKTRDSDLLTESNFAAIMKSLKWWADRGLVWTETFGHWACGWTENIVIRVHNDHGQLYPGLIARVTELYESLNAYPVLDEDDWSERENDAAMEYLTYEISRTRPDPDDDDPDESDRIRAYGARSGFDLACLVLNYWPDGASEGSYPDDDQIESIILKHPARYCQSCGRETPDDTACPTCPTLFTLPA